MSRVVRAGERSKFWDIFFEKVRYKKTTVKKRFGTAKNGSVDSIYLITKVRSNNIIATFHRPSPDYLPIAQNRREQGDIAVP